jgi:hypothetical protein
LAVKIPQYQTIKRRRKLKKKRKRKLNIFQMLRTKKENVILTFDLFVLLEAYDEQRQAVSVVITGTVCPAHAIA